MNDVASPFAFLEEATAQAAMEFEGTAKVIAGYPQEEPPAPLVEFPHVEAPQHPPPPPAAPLRCRTLPHSIPRIDHFYNKIASDYAITTPLLLSRLLFLMLFLYLFFHFLLHLLDSYCFNEFFSFFLPQPDSYPTMGHQFLPRKALLRWNRAKRRIWKQRTINEER